MNKMLTISLVAALGVVGGGSYMLMSSDKNFSEYVPESVSSLIGDYLPDNFKPAQQEIIDTSSGTASVKENNTTLAENSVPATFEVQQVQIQPEAIAEIQPQEIVKNSNSVVEEETIQITSDQSNESVVEIAMQEIRNDLNGVSKAVGTASNNPKATIIENKIVTVGTKISKLDLENKELKEKFENILRKNRELAKQLQAIDKQLTQSK